MMDGCTRTLSSYLLLIMEIMHAVLKTGKKQVEWHVGQQTQHGIPPESLRVKLVDFIVVQSYWIAVLACCN